MRCKKCGVELPTLAAFCLTCGTVNALGCGVFYANNRIYLFFIAEKGCESYSFDVYDDEFEISKRNVFELIALKIHEKRLNEVIVSGVDREALLEAAEWIKSVSVHNLSVLITDAFNSPEEFRDAIARHLRTKSTLKKVDMKPEDKIGGAHTTIIGGRDGVKLLHRLAACEYVKKIIPGIIEAKGIAVGGGVRLKLTRSDEKGNIRAILIDGASVQKILIVTTASSAEEGEEVRKILEGYLS